MKYYCYTLLTALLLCACILNAQQNNSFVIAIDYMDTDDPQAYVEMEKSIYQPEIAQTLLPRHTEIALLQWKS